MFSVRKTLDNLENLKILRKEKNLYYFSNQIYKKWFSYFFKQYYEDYISLNSLCKQEDFESNSKISILFLCAEPATSTRIRLCEEIREIKEKLQLAKLRNRFELNEYMAVRAIDLTQALLDTNPQIVHFSGHGMIEGTLCFEDKLGRVHLVESEALSEMFKQFSGKVKCVILNSCYSKIQAEAIAKYIEYVIGMSQVISDPAAIAFATGFYQALGAGRSIEEAYNFGCVQIRLQGISEHLTPVLIKFNFPPSTNT
ncbi:CHAT domain-containing protein [Tolypothrix bouteillei VB521301]|uniref:CHAT domain-containing protein n=1 Tax=Tolypothrix bouteillei VB521301 TaxID=1479485 RepID=A0A8S9TH15_9CYAN|nr:CHAT domain-containing protein [Tolypothrix bouteillei VB521301]